MSIEVSTATYQFSHGHTPRGRGYWAFEIAGETYWSTPNQSYSEAKADAITLARSKGADRVSVLP